MGADIQVQLVTAGRWQDAKVRPAMKSTSVLTSEGLFWPRFF